MRIALSKQGDGAVVLRCTREDGSTTWQKQTRHAAHFVLHDLTHYAVETTLGCKRGFFGLIAEGWDIEDTTGKGKRGALPEETTDVEHLVGLFDTERGAGVLWTVEEFNTYAKQAPTEEEIRRIHELRGELFKKWFALPPGETLKLEF